MTRPNVQTSPTSPRPHLSSLPPALVLQQLFRRHIAQGPGREVAIERAARAADELQLRGAPNLDYVMALRRLLAGDAVL